MWSDVLDILTRKAAQGVDVRVIYDGVGSAATLPINYPDQLHARGMPISQVVVEGARRRLRPVLMTASIAALGLVPLLFATGPGSEVQRPLAIVVIGGLVSATALTLLLLPLLYRRFGIAPAAPTAQ